MEVSRPWGKYIVLTEESGYKVKKIILNPKQKISLQLHEHRSEFWVVLSGYGQAILGEDVLKVGPNSHIHIPKKVKHRLENESSDQLLILIEVQVGSILSETDIIRYDDIYNRGN